MHVTWPAKTPGAHVNTAVIELQTSLVSEGQVARIRKVHHFFLQIMWLDSNITQHENDCLMYLLQHVFSDMFDGYLTQHQSMC